MKIKYTLFFLFFLAIKVFGQGDIYFNENFDSTVKPADWTYEYVVTIGGNIDWKFQNGGYAISGNPGDGSAEPPFAYQGSNNAVFNYVSTNGETTKLITPPINMEFGIKPELRFWHAQANKLGSHDNLKVYYKNDTSTNWNLLKEYSVEIPNWIEQVIQLPDSTLTDNYYLAFEGITNNGFGTCIDSLIVIETGVIGKTIESVSVKQSSSNDIPTSSINNKILRVDFKVKGNDGVMNLDSMTFISLNTNDDDIAVDGAKLFYSEDTLFINSEQKASENFSNGKISFGNLNIILEPGFSSVWLLYDIKDDTDHNMQDNVLDAYVPEDGIKINNYYYPFTAKSPEGERKIVESIFSDDFETDKAWVRTPEFERAIPLGYGGIQNIGSTGKADPTYATSGSYVLGTDLTDDGDYENSLTDREYSASSPTISTKYYIDTKIYFNRWINVQVTDSAYIDLSVDNGSNWVNIWQNSDNIREGNWNQLDYDIKNYAERKDQIKVRFALGGTDDAFPMSGWNIDDFFVTGNFLSKDVGITSWNGPVGGCGHTDEELVEVTIQNYAGETLSDPLVLSYSLDGGTTIKYDTIQNPNLAVDASMTYTIDKPADLTTPGWYHNVYATTNLDGDEDNRNDKYSTKLFISPTYTLPYSENFENDYGYFRDDGVNSSWEYGVPSGTIIDTAASGTKAWVTNLEGSYLNSDSSYIETPCFDFTGVDSIIFEFRCIGISEDQVDGLTIMYSFDNGTTWDFLPNDHDFYWNWYNETNISSLGSAGFDNTSGDWLLMRQLLPPNFSNKSSAKFRFLFKSSESAIYEGFGIDDVKVYKAPADVGVNSITEPFTACEWSDATQVKVNVENFGITTLAAGSKIPIGLHFQGSYYTTDTLTLATTLAPGGTAEFTFTETVDMSTTGDYNFSAYTLLESDPYFYNETVCNDTTTVTARVDGMPNYDIGWIVGSDDLDTLLDAGAGYNSYSWYFDGSEVGTNQTYRTEPSDGGGIYYITVTRIDALTCEADDSLKVVQSLLDVRMDSIRTTLKDSCERFELTELWASITNKNVSFIEGVNDTIPFGYQINNLPEVYDTLFLEGRDLTTVPPNDTISFKFDEKCDLTAPGKYTIRVFTNSLEDLDRTDDTVTTTINTWGLPDVDLAYDTIYSSQADTLTLDAGPGFISYLWSPGDSTTQTITPTNSSYYYKVTVTADHSCGTDEDSTYIETHDLGITDVASPVDICEDNATGLLSLDVEITNFSDSVYNTTTETIYYEYDGGAPVMATPTVSVAAGGSTVVNIGSIDASAVGEHTIKVYTSSDIDANHSNDTAEYTFNTWPLPEVDLSYDTIFTTKADTVELIAKSGLASYNWSDGSSNDTLNVTKKYSYNYVVTVADVNGCGTAEDSTQIITYDIGISELTSPISACEHQANEKVTVSVKNYGYDTLKIGTVIPVSYTINGGVTINENFTLSSKLDPLSSTNYTFSARADLSGVSSYNFELFAGLEFDVRTSNNTYTDVIKTFGYPSVSLGSDIWTTQPDTVYIIADPGYNSYQWNDGSNNDTLEVTYLASKNYTVTVYDINGCTATDDMDLYTYDLAASNLVTPVSKCELTSIETVSMDVINNSQDTLLTGDQVNVSYVLNSGSPVNESFTLTDSLKPGETVNYSFTQTADLSNNQVHQFNLYAERNSIDVESNDVITRNVDYQKPNLELGPLVNTGATQYTIDAGAGYTSYLWFDGSTNQTYTVDINNENTDNLYSVTVTNSYGCEASDSKEVVFTTTPDLSLTNMSSPTGDCWQKDETYPVTVTVTNVGVVNLDSEDNFIVGYRINGGDPVTETFDLTTAMNANDTRQFTFPDISFSEPNTYLFKPFVKVDNDDNVNNDTAHYNVDITAPEVDLGNDTIYFEESYEISTQQSYSSYEWSTGETTPTIDVTTTGTYSVTITDNNGCQGIGTIHCVLITGVDNLIKGDGYSLTYYPNPASEKVLIEMNNSKPADIQIQILSLNGRIVYNNELKRIENVTKRIDVNRYASGVYYLRFRINKDFYTRKLIIQ